MLLQPDEQQSSASFSSFNNAHDYVFDLILKENWRDIIKILAKDMDPWDIDLKILSERFTHYLQEMKEKDLKIPGKIILVSAIVYRMKSDLLKEENQEEQESLDLLNESFTPELGTVMVNEEQKELNIRHINLPPIRLPIKKPVKRKITLNELINALDKALKPKRRSEAKELFNIDLKDFDITEAIEKTYEKIIKELEKQDKTFFSKLLPPTHKSEDKIRLLQSLLHLAFEGRITCWQEKPFEEIYISKGEVDEQ
ncbi:MAG: segregation/condensation protein A, partial [Candidatus Nanohaloarchaeota archaeon]|nr:segregation/condensation protein A [Candidatus Nanohaloarchaeota archaeon]